MKKTKANAGVEHFYPLLRCELVPITDPAEIAALERRIQAAEKAMARGSNGKKPKSRKKK
jgi:hypothetical protein